ncbi:addiction module protein [Methylolobus aquaticus]|nr:addiction module protein [Methylolobus aquaticus]
MNTNLKSLSVDERIQLVEDLCDSIAVDQGSLPLTEEQKVELDRRLQAFEVDRNPGRLASNVIKDIRSRLPPASE